MAPWPFLQSASVTGEPPFDASFNLSYCSHTDGLVMAYTLDFGDGADPATGTEFNIAIHHTYEVNDVYTATLTITDSTGTQDTDTLEITVDSDGPPVGTLVGATAPDFTAHTTAGGEIALSDYRGDVILLDFWGSWCAPCRKSMPHLDDLVSTYGGDGLVAIIVSTDVDESDSIEFLADNGYTDFVSVWEAGGKAGSPITQIYGVDSSSVGIPRTYVLDRDGVIRYIGLPLDITEDLIEALL